MFRKSIIVTILFILAAVGRAYAASNPVALWHMDEATAIDSSTISDSAGSNHGTLYTGEGTVNKATAGKVGGAISFDGTDDYVDCGSGASLNVGTSDFSIEGWIKYSGSFVNKGIFAKKDTYSSTDGGYSVFTDNVGVDYHITLTVSNGSDYQLIRSSNSNMVLSSGVWTYFAIVVDRTAATVTFYKDSNSEVKTLTLIGSYNSANNVRIGKLATWYFPGPIDEVAIYNRALTAEEIAEDYWTGMKVWPFSVASAYSYDTSKIEITGGVAKLKALGTTLKDDAVVEYNSAFVAGDTTRGYSGTASGADVSLVLETASATLYKASGTFESRVFDTASGCGGWQRLNATVVNGDIPNADSLFDSGLVGLWHLNGTVGTIANGATIPSATGQNNGTAYDTNGTMAYVAGKLSQGISFDGTDDRVDIVPPLPEGQANYTIEAWFKTFSNSIVQVVWEQNYSVITQHRRAAMLLIGSGNWGFNGESNDAHDKVPVRVNEWVHGVITIEKNAALNPVKIYENGVLYWQGNTSTNAVNLNVGVNYAGLGVKYNGAGGERFYGLIDEVSIWNRALDSSEIADHYNAGAGKELHRAAKFQVRSGNTVGELTGYGFAGSLGDSTSYYTGANETLVSGGGFNTTHRFAQYKAWLNASTDSTRTPTVASVALVGTAGSVFDNTKGDFDLGTYSTTTTSPVGAAPCGRPFVGLGKMPNGGYMSCGYYISHVFYSGDGTSPNWQPLTWTLGGTEIDASENGLVGLWHMNGNWLDAKGTNNGAASGAVFSTSAKLGSACGSFNGTTDFVDCGNGASLNITNVITIEAWIKPTVSGSGSYRCMMAKRLSGATNYEFYLKNDAGANQGRLSWYSGTEVPSSFIPVVGTWTHVAATVSGTNLIIYANGVAVLNTTIAAITTNAGIFAIGRTGSDVSEWFSGLIDEVAIYNRALSASEVMNHYQNANPGTVKFQCRADSTVAGLATKTFTGYDSTSATFYETSGSGWGAQYDGRRYFQYRAHLEGR